MRIAMSRYNRYPQAGGQSDRWLTPHVRSRQVAEAQQTALDASWLPIPLV